MRPLALLVVVLAGLSVSACGEDSGSSNARETSADTPTGDAAVTAREFARLPVPDEFKLVERLAAANPDACSSVNPRSEPFRQAVFINAAQAKPGTLISELVAAACEAG